MRLCALGLVGFLSCGYAADAAPAFFPDRPWMDNQGIHINAHGGGVFFHEGTYYWCGEHKISGSAGNRAEVGVHMYSSQNLYHWKDEGIALAVSPEAGSDIERGCIIERPKVIYNDKFKRFVMWFHLELKGSGYDSARVGVAVSDRPAGPFVFLKSFRPDAGSWPINVTEEQKYSVDRVDYLKGKKFSGGRNPDTPRHPILSRDYAGGQMSRDMNLFVDDDGAAYQIRASEENSTIHISQLSDDFLSTSGKFVRVFPCQWNEAPVLFKDRGRYWMLSSDCTGWNPNPARSAVADSIWGPWREIGNPCRGINAATQKGPEVTFGGQSTSVFPVNGKPGAYIAMFDVWRPSDAITGGYIFLPVHFENDKFTISWMDSWDLSQFNK